MTVDVVTVGETMVLLRAPEVGALRHVHTLAVGVAGAESNLAIGVQRLGLRAAWVGRVGDDEFGRLVLGRIRAEGVDVSTAVADPDVPTSLLVKERRTADAVRVVYYRRDGPGARLRPDDLDEALIRGARLLHVTGITPALSAGARATVRRAVALARDAGTLVSLDLNYRAALWSRADAARELRELTALADLVFAGDDEAALVARGDAPAALAAGLAALGPGVAVVKLGAAGAVAHVDGRPYAVAAVPVRAVDPVGAGDAFVAGYLVEHLAGLAPDACLATAATCGAFAVTVPGDWEGLPSRSELALLGRAAGTVLR